MPTTPLTTIMYVEDEPDIRDIAKLVLENVGGFQVVTAESGQVALDLIEGAQPDLILLDAMMPGMDGKETFKAIRGLPDYEETPIAFLTAKLMEKDVENFMELGAIGVIAKPFDPMSLSEQVLELWAKA